MPGRPPATTSDASHKALAMRLSREMMEAERQGFGTSTIWLTRAETDLICVALQMASGGDSARLDFMDRCVAAMTARDGSIRNWHMTIAEEGLSLGASSVAQRPVTAVSGHATCRAAIDQRITELESARAFTVDNQNNQRKVER